MPKFAPFPQTATATQLQRSPRDVIRRVKASKEPLFIMRNNTVELVILDASLWDRKTKELWEQKQLRKAVAAYEKDRKGGKLKTLKGNLSDLFDR